MTIEIPKTPQIPLEIDYEDQRYDQRYDKRYDKRYDDDEDENENENEEIIWIDLYEGIYLERLIFLSGVIDNAVVTDIISLLLFFGVEDDDIFLYINSPGGEALSGIAICDTINALIPDVSTLVMGFAASVASLILSGGSYTKRGAFPHARVMIHQPVIAPISASPEILASEAEEMVQLRSTIADIYAKNTGKPVSVIQQDLERDKYMSALEARNYGILDTVIEERIKDGTSE
jgi:ATP-dependent Clp protease protease subunit